MKNIMMTSSISLLLLAAPLAAGNSGSTWGSIDGLASEMDASTSGTAAPATTSAAACGAGATAPATETASASAAEAVPPVFLARLPETSLLHISEFSSVLRFTGDASFDERVRLALNFLFQGVTKEDRKYIIEELNKLSKNLLLNPEFHDALSYLMTETMDNADRVSLIKALAKAPSGEWKALAEVLSPFLSDIDSLIANFHIKRIIDAFVSIPANERKELAEVVRPFGKDPIFRGSIIEKFAGIPAAERKMMANFLLPIIADIEDGSSINDIIEVFASLPAREWEEFADAVRPCSKYPIWRYLIINAFVEVPAESRTLFSNVVGPFVDTVNGDNGLHIVQEFVKVPPMKLEVLAKIVRPHVEAVRDSVKEELINVFNRAPETEWERVSNMVSRHIRDIDECFEVREKILDDIVHGREVVIPPGAIRHSPPLPKRLRSAADESSDEEYGLK